MSDLQRIQTYGTLEALPRPANGTPSPSKTAIDVTSEGQVECQNKRSTQSS